MGICSSCCGGGDSSDSRGNNERTHLLSDPASSSSSNRIRVDGYDYLPRNANSLPKHDEQSALSRILMQTATNVIDVGTLDNHDLEQTEYYERMKAYSSAVNGMSRWLPPPKAPLLLVDVPQPEKVLAAPTISPETLDLITSSLEGVTQAVAQVRVEHKEDLVVAFGIPLERIIGMHLR